MKTKLITLMTLFAVSNVFAAPSVDEVVESAVAYSVRQDMNGVEFFKYYTENAKWNEDELFKIFAIVLDSFKLELDDYNEICDLLYKYCKANLAENSYNRILYNYVSLKDAERKARSEFSGPNTNTNLWKTPKGDPRPNPVPVTPDPISSQN